MSRGLIITLPIEGTPEVLGDKAPAMLHRWLLDYTHRDPRWLEVLNLALELIEDDARAAT